MYRPLLLGRHEQIEKNETGRACSTYGGEQRCVQGLVGEPEGKRQLGRSRPRWQDNIKMDLQEVGCRGHRLDWSDSGQGQVTGCGESTAVMNVRVSSKWGIS